MSAGITLIYARAANGVIGKGGTLPWRLPEDMAHFRRLTAGSNVIMGRKTWDSLPAAARPLPGRNNIVITRQENWGEIGAKPAASLRDALLICDAWAPIFIIGGEQIYAEAMPYATTVSMTYIDQDYDGDAFAPRLIGDWYMPCASPWLTGPLGERFRFERHKRIGPAKPYGINI